MKNRKMRFGFNVNGAALGDQNYFISFVKRIKPTTILIMDNMSLALRLHDELEGKTNVIHRAYQDGDGEYWFKRSPKDVAEMLMRPINGSAHHHIWKQVMNEPMTRGSDWKKLSDWAAETSRIMADNNHKSVPLNLAVGTYELHDVTNGYFDSIIKVAGEFRNLVGFGIHEYTAFLLPFGIGLWDRWSLRDPEFVQPSNWPEPDKIPEYKNEYGKQYYHLMRSTWFQVRAKEINVPEHHVFLTEFGWDRLPDLTSGKNHIYESLERKFGVPSPYSEMRGPYTYANLWKAYYPKWSTAQAIIEQFKWADSVYPDWYTGFMPFMWGFGGEWERFGFNFGADKELHDLMIDWAEELNDQTEEAPVQEKPSVPVVTPPVNKTVDLLEYLRGDGRIYDVSYNFPGGPGTGTERMQTQIENANSRRFFHVKGAPGTVDHNWEELWYDDQFIWRGADTSEENFLYVTDMVENGKTIRGHKWINRFASIGTSYHIICTTSFKRASDGSNDPNRLPYTFNGWLVLNKIHDQYTFPSGITLNDVVELWGYLDDNGRPSLNFERYWYAKNYGLVAWSDPTKNWNSYISKINVDMKTPLKREVLSWLTLPDLPAATTTPPTPSISLSDSRWKRVMVASISNASNIRQMPLINAPKVAVITKAEAPALILFEEKQQRSDGVWYPIRVNLMNGADHSNGDFSNFGWIRADVFTFKEYVPPPVVLPPEDYNTFTLTVRYLVTDRRQSSMVDVLKTISSALKENGLEVSAKDVD